jgi:hypothetical protein
MKIHDTEEPGVPLTFSKREPAQPRMDGTKTSPQQDARTTTVTEVARENRDND